MSRHTSPVRPSLSALNVDLPSLQSLASDDLASSSTSRGRSFSQVKLPSFRISTAGSQKSPSRRSFGYERPSVTQQPDPTQKYRDESRKLLAHILGQLRDRTRPESVFNGFKSGGAYDPDSKDLRTTARVMQGVVKFRAGLAPQARSQTSTQDDSDSDIEEGIFSTDATLNLLSQFVSALAVAVKAGWQIFDDGDSLDEPSTAILRIPRRTSRSKSGHRSRSSSPLRGRVGRLPAPNLLAHSITVLASIVSEDCRFQVAAPRPSRPPNALQSVVLDAAGYLLHMNRRNPKVVSRIGFALLPAFYTFRPEMHIKLLAFFDAIVMRPMLESLREAQGNVLVEAPARDIDPDESVIQIHVEEAGDLTSASENLRWKPWSSLPSKSANTPSSNAPSQDLAVYHLSSLVPPLLSTVFKNINILNTTLPSLHKFFRLFGTIIDAKPDAYLDVFEVVAYSSARARQAAIVVLSTYWPRALGHLVVTKMLPTLNPLEFSKTLSETATSHMDQYHHSFVPWNFDNSSDALSTGCSTCGEELNGYGLVCPLCRCCVHFKCYTYPEGCSLAQYDVDSAGDGKAAQYRFCYSQPSRRFGRTELRKSRHSFWHVNIFTLTLCFLCEAPLWGNTTQGMKCSECHRFAHPKCLSRSSSKKSVVCEGRPTYDARVRIPWAALRQSFVESYKGFVYKLDQLNDKSYEEVSVLYSALWIQLQMLQSGISLGSIVVGNSPSEAASGPTRKQLDDKGIRKFELHYLIQLYHSFLTEGNLRVSQTFEEYFLENDIHAEKHLICFDWGSLVYILTVIKSPPSQLPLVAASSSDLLDVGHPEGSKMITSPVNDTETAHTYEISSLAHVRDALGMAFDITSDDGARYLISHLNSLGFLERTDLAHLWVGDDATTKYEEEYCNFPLPVGLDLSNEVETLAAAIEACLSDLDLSVNEIGLLLLTRRFWYDGMITDNALRRLTKGLISWILAEVERKLWCLKSRTDALFGQDDCLATILRDYVPKGLALPGVRSTEAAPWPPHSSTYRAPGVSFHNGRVYIDYRRELMSRYAAKWMGSLHDHDRSGYADMIFQLSRELSEDSTFETGPGSGPREAAERHLRSIIKLGQTPAIFTVFEDVIEQWLDLLPMDHRQSYPVLIRLFNKDAEAAGRGSVTLENTTFTSMDVGGLATIEPWKILFQVASDSKEGVKAGLRYEQMLGLIQQSDSSWEDFTLLIDALFCATWLRSLGRQELQTIVSNIHVSVCSRVVEDFKTNKLDDAIAFLKQSLATCLLLFGCERERIVSFGFVEEADVADLPSRRKLNARAMRHPDFVGVDSGLINALYHYVQAGVDEVSVLIAQFFTAVVNEATLLEPHEIDNTILRNGSAMVKCAWDFYAIQHNKLATSRISFLLRLIVVDVEPFLEIWSKVFSSENWEARFDGTLRLFRMVLDVTHPAFQIEDRQWRPSVIEIFNHYFSCIWKDPTEEIRLAVDTWSQTLLPAHFEAISACWNEALSKAPVTERVKLVTFLIHLLPHFPRWPVLSWPIIIETLLEDDYERRMGDHDPASAHLSLYGIPSGDPEVSMIAGHDKETRQLRECLLLLSLQMVSNGVPADVYSLLRLKVHLVRSFGFRDVSEVPSGNGQAFFIQFGTLRELPESSHPCLNEFVNLLDAYQPFDIAPSAIGGPFANDDLPTSLLVGSVFVDVFLAVFNEAVIDSLPFIVLKNLIKCVMIVTYKHDLESRPLRHLQASFRKVVRKLNEVVMMDLSYEVRQLALTACGACIKRWPNMVGSIIYESLEGAAQLIVSLDHNSEDELVIQTRSFVETILLIFSTHGVFNTLCKRNLDPSFFTVLRNILERGVITTANGDPLGNALLRDTLTRAVDNDLASFQQVLDNLNTFIEAVHHSGFSAELMQVVGLSLTNITRKTAEWSYGSFDASPLFLMASTLIQNNQAQSRELLLYLENVLRAVLLRFHASPESLKRIFRVTSALYKRYNAQNQSGGKEVSANSITDTMLEILSDGLRGKARIPSSTVSSVLEVVIDPETDTPTKQLVRYAEDGMFYLLSYTPTENFAQADYIAAETVAKLITLLADKDLISLINIVSGLNVERPSRAGSAVRGWNFLLSAALKAKSVVVAKVLFSQFSLFVRCFQLSLRHLMQLSLGSQDMGAADINRAYVSIKLWLLLVHMFDSVQAGVVEGGIVNENSAKMIWNELWPSFETILLSLENDALNGSVSPVAILIWSSVAELFVFLRQAHVSVALETSPQVALLNRLRPLVGGGETSKFARLAKSISSPVNEIAFDVLVNQTASDMMAAEKLHALESTRKDRVQAPERARREIRVTS